MGFELLETVEDGADQDGLIQQQVDAVFDPGPFGEKGGQRAARQARLGRPPYSRPVFPAVGVGFQVGGNGLAVFEHVEQDLEVVFLSCTG